MPWTMKNTGEVWTGEVHELAGQTYSGRTRTYESSKLVWVEAAQKSDASSTPKVNEAKVAKKKTSTRKVKKNA